MANKEKAAKNKTDSKEKGSTKRQDLQPLYDQSLTWDDIPIALTETPFHPSMNEHAAILAGTSFFAQRHELIMQLQRTYGNTYVQRLLNSKVVQAKLAVSNPNDLYEQEADRVAGIVTREINSPVQRQKQEEELQMQSVNDQTGSVSGKIEAHIEKARGGGHPISNTVREPMECAFGTDFNNVRVHTDLEADVLNQALSAKAFTVGQDVYFRQGHYNPDTSSGRELIAHELTHVVQQTGRASASYIQRNGGDPPEKPYGPANKPPKFEYWVNSMWMEVPDKEVKKEVLALLKGTEAAPRAGENIDDATKKNIMDRLYANAYQERVWVSAEELLEEESLEKMITLPEGTTLAIGFHGTGRDPNTVLKAHGGTIPTIARHNLPPKEKAKIHDYLENGLGIKKAWHPFWFGGEIENRPFLYRNVQGDNELDTSVSVAKAAIDSIDFPMIESMDAKDRSKCDAYGFPETVTYVYLVGVSEGFGTSVNLQNQIFGQGEIATKGIKPDDHLGYAKYIRKHAGGSRNDGFTYKKDFVEALPGARIKRVSDQVMSLLDSMPGEGAKYLPDPDKMDGPKIEAKLKEEGEEAFRRGGRITRQRTEEQWKKWAERTDLIQSAPSEVAKTRRINAFLDGVKEASASLAAPVV